jgi:dinuclear metal center YbgI/SA1388 family protein
MTDIVPLERIVQYIDVLLAVHTESDREGNGLALTASGTVSKIGAAVNTSFESIRQAKERGIDLLLVHHTSWDVIDLHLREEKLALLKAQGTSLYAAHESLDRASGFGTADTLAVLLGMSIEGRFMEGQGVFGRFDVSSFAALVKRSERVLGVPVESWENNRHFVRGAIATGGAGYTSYLREAQALGCDTYITGEGSMYTKLFAREVGMNLLFGSHYATELPGIKAFAEHVAGEFGLPWETIGEDLSLR